MMLSRIPYLNDATESQRSQREKGEGPSPSALPVASPRPELLFPTSFSVSSVSLWLPLLVLLLDVGDRAGAHRAPALPDGEAQPLLHGDRRDQLHRHLRVVPRHHHLHALGQSRHPRHLRRPEVELRPVTREKRRVPTPLLL